MQTFVISSIISIIVITIVYYIVYAYISYRKHKPAGGYPEIVDPIMPHTGLFKVGLRATIDAYYNKLAQVDNKKCPVVGIHIFTGRQGAGKTLSAVRWARHLKKMYPDTKTLANIEILQDDTGFNDVSPWRVIEKWGDVQADELTSTLVVLDEIQTWASSLQSSKVPPELLGLATQQRKRKMAIIGTAQVPTRVAKPLREQCYRWYHCTQLFGVITRVDVYDGDQLDDDGKYIDRPLKTMYYIPSLSDYLSYDTLKVVADVDVTNYEMWRTDVPTKIEVNNFEEKK